MNNKEKCNRLRKGRTFISRNCLFNGTIYAKWCEITTLHLLQTRAFSHFTAVCLSPFPSLSSYLCPPSCSHSINQVIESIMRRWAGPRALDWVLWGPHLTVGPAASRLICFPTVGAASLAPEVNLVIFIISLTIELASISAHCNCQPK